MTTVRLSFFSSRVRIVTQKLSFFRCPSSVVTNFPPDSARLAWECSYCEAKQELHVRELSTRGMAVVTYLKKEFEKAKTDLRSW